jgi:hypothetical protein
MPTYDLRCSEGHVAEAFIPLSRFDDALDPCECGAPRQRVIAPPMIHHGEIYDYRSVIDGEHVNSRRGHHEHMKKHNVVEAGDEPPKPRVEKPFDWKSGIGEAYAELKVTGKIND